MKKLILLFTAFICFLNFSYSQSPGELDPAFGTNGIVKSTVASFNSTAVQANGKIIAGGDKALIRYNTNGSLDNSFGKDGIRATGFLISAIKIQKDGKIVAAGDSTIARYNTDGSLDKTFSGDGKQTTDFTIRKIAIANDGKIAVGGSVIAVFGDFIARYNTNGSPDNTFDSDGKATVPFSVKDIAVQDDGKVIVVGGGGYGGFSLARFNTNGSLDSTFNNDGIQDVSFNLDYFYSDDPWSYYVEFDLYAGAVAIQSDKKIIVTGSADIINSSRGNEIGSALARYNTDGSIDSSFGGYGVTIGYEGGQSDLTSNNSIAIQDDGKIVTSGSYGSYRSSTLIRYTTDGVTDYTFGNSEIQIDNIIQSIAIVNNKLYAVGYGSSADKTGIAARYFLDYRPSVYLSAVPYGPYDTVKYSGPANIKLNASATDGDGTITKVEFYNGTTLLHTETVIPYGFLWKNVPVGNYTLTVKAYDNSGNVAATEPLNVSVVNYNLPPTVEIVAPYYTNHAEHATIHFVAEAKDANDKISKVAFYNGTTLLHTETVAPYGYWWSNVQPGTYTITAVATDDKGLSATSYPSVIYVFPNKVPTVSLTNPANNKTFTGPANIKLDAVAKDPDDDAIIKVEFYNGKTLLHTETVVPYGFLWKNVPVGNYFITAKAYDNWGVAATSTVVNISVIPNVAPTVSIINPANKESFIAPATITLAASARDADGKISKVEFYNGTTLLRTEKFLPYTYNWQNATPGTYTVTAVATDDKGLSATSAPVTITVTSPAASIVSSRPSAKQSETGENDVISVKLYPNPAKNVLSINTTGLQQSKPSSISVISASGVVVKTMQLNASNRVVQLDVSSLISGVYTVKIMSGDKILYKQFVKL